MNHYLCARSRFEAEHAVQKWLPSRYRSSAVALSNERLARSFTRAHRNAALSANGAPKQGASIATVSKQSGLHEIYRRNARDLWHASRGVHGTDGHRAKWSENVLVNARLTDTSH
jgi:hypothetical protein